MKRWIVFVGLLVVLLAARLQPASAACGTERRLLPNGRFETVPKQNCYPDLHSAPMSNAPPGMGAPIVPRCRTVQERVLQPNGRFAYQQVQRCS
jgi:hypothetical protein